MDKYRETFDTWNRIATLYEEKFMHLEMYNDSYDVFCKAVIPVGAKILEIGCGPGNVTKYLLSKRPDFKLFGIDIAPNMVELAIQNNPEASFAVMDCRSINQLENTYDGIIGGFCLPYLSKDEATQFIFSASKKLKNHGVIYLSFVEGKESESGFKTSSEGRVFFYYHDLSEILQQFKLAGFINTEVFKVPYPSSNGSEVHTIVVAHK